jgi:hypothetical protein
VPKQRTDGWFTLMHRLDPHQCALLSDSRRKYLAAKIRAEEAELESFVERIRSARARAKLEVDGEKKEVKETDRD